VKIKEMFLLLKPTSAFNNESALKSIFLNLEVGTGGGFITRFAIN